MKETPHTIRTRQRRGTRGALCAALAATLFGLGAAPAARAEIYAAEGPIQAVTNNGGGSGSIQVFGVVVDIPAGTPIESPSATLSMGQLASGTSLPGRTQPGFIGGTTIIDGTIDPATLAVTAASVFVEPAENVTLGVFTSAWTGTSIGVNGTPAVLLTDPRIPGEVTNDFGLPIDPSTIPVGALASVEGYFGDADQQLHAFLITSSAGTLADPATPQVAILRARCAIGGTLTVDGSVYDPNETRDPPPARTITVLNPGLAAAPKNFPTNATSTTVPTLAIDGGGPTTQTFRYRTGVNASDPDTDNGACPSTVRVRVQNPLASADATVFIRGVVPAPPVGGVNTSPVAVNDTFTVAPGQTIAINPLLNDTDAEGNIAPGTLAIQSGPTVGTITNLAGGEFDYTAPGSAGQATITYNVADTGGLVSNTATITINIQVPSMETVVIDRAVFRTGKNRWVIRGTSDIPGSTVTAVLSSDPASPEIGTAVVDVTGAWIVARRNTGVIPSNANRQVTVTSTGGGTATLQARIRN